MFKTAVKTAIKWSQGVMRSPLPSFPGCRVAQDSLDAEPFKPQPNSPGKGMRPQILRRIITREKAGQNRESLTALFKIIVRQTFAGTGHWLRLHQPLICSLSPHAPPTAWPPGYSASKLRAWVLPGDKSQWPPPAPLQRSERAAGRHPPAATAAPLPLSIAHWPRLCVGASHPNNGRGLKRASPLTCPAEEFYFVLL